MEKNTYPELCHIEGNVLVEGIQNHTTNSVVTPCAMNKKQLSKVSELSNRNIRRPSCLETFHTADTNTNMGSLNHGHIVGTIANSKEQRFEMSFNQFNNERLLEGRNATSQELVSLSSFPWENQLGNIIPANHCLAHNCQV